MRTWQELTARGAQGLRSVSELGKRNEDEYHDEAVVPWSHPAYEQIAALFTSRTGIICPPSRREAIEAGIERARQQSAAASLWDYALGLQAAAIPLDALIGELAIGETYFFRERDHLEALRTYVLPELVRSAVPGRPLRIWSAGCASGEEAYGLAILLEQEGLLGAASILGTDIAVSALTKARAALYKSWSLRGVEPAIIRRYFRPEGNHFALADHIKKAVRFEQHNLITDDPPAGERERFDLILCRNVMIYFESSLIRALADRFYRSLRDGGWLLTGASDTPLWDYAPFTGVSFPGSIFYRRAEPASSTSPAPAVPPHLAAAPPVKQPATLADAEQAAAEGRWELAESLAAELPSDAPAVCLVRIQVLGQRQGPTAALAACAQAITAHPSFPPLHLLSAILLLETDRAEEAARAARRAVYLDRSSPLAHYVLGLAAQRCGDHKEAHLSYRNARDLAAALPKDVRIPLFTEGRAASLAQRASVRMNLSPRDP